MAAPGDEEPELTRPFALSKLNRQGRETVVKVVATNEECDALAERFDLVGLHQLAAIVTLRRGVGDTTTARGNLTAVVTQQCVVSSEEFAQTVRAKFAVLLHASAQGMEDAGEATFFDQAEDVDEEVLDDPTTLDVGELVAQYLYLNVDQFPRKPGVTFDGYFDQDAAGPAGSVGEGAEAGSFTLGSLFPDLPDDLVDRPKGSQ